MWLYQSTAKTMQQAHYIACKITTFFSNTQIFLLKVLFLCFFSNNNKKNIRHLQKTYLKKDL